MYSSTAASQGAKHANSIDAVTRAIVGQSVLTLLETRVLAGIASYPEDWRTARASVEAIAQQCGRGYHPQSWRRAKRKLDNLGLIESTRLLTGDPLPAAAKKSDGSQYGTTVKRVLWSALGLSPRRVRAVRKAQRLSQTELLRRAEQAKRAREKSGAAPMPDGFVPTPIRVGAQPTGELAALVAGLMQGAAMVSRARDG